MKKIILLFFMTLLLCGCSIGAAGANSKLDFLTLFSSSSQYQDKIWVGTFQLVFNEMKNKLFKREIKFQGIQPTDELIGLNREEFKASMLNDSSYYLSFGETSPEAKEKIKRAIKQKFNETSDIIDKLNWKKEKGKYYAYAMLKKEFEFLKEFDKLDDAGFNASNQKYKYFGIKDSSDDILDKNVSVLFYNNSNDYAVRLLTKSGDIVYLYRNDKNAPLSSLYSEMQKKAKAYSKGSKFNSQDTLMVPNLKVNLTKNYPELCNKRIAGPENLMFTDAIETLQFELNNKGGKVKSEAAFMTATCAIEPYVETKPRHFNFNKTFNLFLVDSNKTNPYLGARIFDLSKFVK